MGANIITLLLSKTQCYIIYYTDTGGQHFKLYSILSSNQSQYENEKRSIKKQLNNAQHCKSLHCASTRSRTLFSITINNKTNKVKTNKTPSCQGPPMVWLLNKSIMMFPITGILFLPDQEARGLVQRAGGSLHLVPRQSAPVPP